MVPAPATMDWSIDTPHLTPNEMSARIDTVDGDSVVSSTPRASTQYNEALNAYEAPIQ